MISWAVATYIISPTGEQRILLVAYSMMQPLEMHDIRIIHPPAPARLKVAASGFLREIFRIEVRKSHYHCCRDYFRKPARVANVLFVDALYMSTCL